MKKIMNLTALLFLAAASYGHAESMRLTVINDSSVSQNLNFGATNQFINLGPGEVKMLTVDYRYPAAITMLSTGKPSKNCNWNMPPMGKQTIRNLTLNISNDVKPDIQNCSITWQ
ncbi:MAG: hypothetical protein JSR33_13965 [Proteobacteria bacterium]|nr:hypothetical protein [Pseudomonadota bacterium]